MNNSKKDMDNEKPKRTTKHNKLIEFYNNESSLYEIGIDEVGRGPMFGRVYCAAVILPKDDSFDHDMVKDSKRFHSKKKLNDAHDYIKQNALHYAVHYRDADYIDEHNIRQSVLSCMHECVKTIKTSYDKKTRLLERDIGKLNERNFRKRTAEAEVRNLGLDNLELDKKRMSTNLKEWTDKIKKQERIVKESKSKLEKIGFDESKYNSIRDKWDKAGDNLNLCIVDLERHRIGVARASENLKNQEEKFQEISRLKSEIKDEERTLHLLRTLEERLKGFRTYLTGRIAPVLQNRTGERLSQITQARYNSVHVDRNDYSIQVMDGTQLYPLERFSGGEIDAFNLAFRLSISDVITERLGSELGMVVLDEVLGSQDYQRQISILEGLEALAKNIGQVLMVTHIEDMKNQLQHVWSVSLDQKKGTQVIKL